MNNTRGPQISLSINSRRVRSDRTGCSSVQSLCTRLNQFKQSFSEVQYPVLSNGRRITSFFIQALLGCSEARTSKKRTRSSGLLCPGSDGRAWYSVSYIIYCTHQGWMIPYFCSLILIIEQPHPRYDPQNCTTRWGIKTHQNTFVNNFSKCWLTVFGRNWWAMSWIN